MKKILTAMLALCMALSLAACNGSDGGGSSSSAESEAEPILTNVRYDPPEGYEVYGVNSTSGSYVKYDEDGEFTHVLEVGFNPASDGFIEGIESKKQSVLEDALFTDFDENLKLTFLERNGRDGLLIEDYEGDRLMGVTYYFIYDQWLAYITSGEDMPDTVEEVREDILTLIDTIRLEEITFSD